MIVKGGKEVQLGMCRDLASSPTTRHSSLAPWQRDSQLANGTSRHEQRHGA